MARFGCLALAVVVAMALLIFIVFLWSGWLNRPVGHAPAAVSVAHDSYRQKQDFKILGLSGLEPFYDGELPILPNHKIP